jgi:hypothetical protein
MTTAELRMELVKQLPQYKIIFPMDDYLHGEPTEEEEDVIFELPLTVVDGRHTKENGYIYGIAGKYFKVYVMEWDDEDILIEIDDVPLEVIEYFLSF